MAVGLDLDGHTDTSCGHPDRVSPRGEEGIDNQFVALHDLFAWTLGDDDVEGEAANRWVAVGGVSVLFHVEPAAEPGCPECLRVTIHPTGAPTEPLQVDAAGRVLPDQTFVVEDPDASSTVTTTPTCGAIRAGPFELVLPLKLPELAPRPFNLRIHEATVELLPGTASGAPMQGVLGGTVDAWEVVNEYSNHADLGLLETHARFLEDADMAPNVDGICQGISIGLPFEAVPAAIE